MIDLAERLFQILLLRESKTVPPLLAWLKTKRDDSSFIVGINKDNDMNDTHKKGGENNVLYCYTNQVERLLLQ